MVQVSESGRIAVAESERLSVQLSMYAFTGIDELDLWDRSRSGSIHPRSEGRVGEGRSLETYESEPTFTPARVFGNSHYHRYASALFRLDTL